VISSATAYMEKMWSQKIDPQYNIQLLLL